MLDSDPKTWKHRFAVTYLRLLTGQNALETWLCLVAMVWGAAVYCVDGFFAVSYNATLQDLMHGHADLFGAYVWFWGAVGLLGRLSTATWARRIRSFSSLCLSFFWGVFAVYFATRTPPVSSAVAVYAMVGLAEAWVYVRVSGYFDAQH